MIILLLVTFGCGGIKEGEMFERPLEEMSTFSGACEESNRFTEWDIFIKALIQVESEGKADAVGKTNDVGILQITPIYVKDVNRIVGEERYTLSCRTDTEKSLEMFEIIQNHYNPKKDIEKAIKLHNPRAGQSYRTKIMNQIEIIKSNLS